MMHATAVSSRAAALGATVASTTNFISRASIRLPRYSGVRPIIRPPRKTASKANSTIPNRPEPGPPMMASPNIMFAIATNTPSGE